MAKRSLILLACVLSWPWALNAQPPEIPPPTDPDPGRVIPVADDVLIADLIRAMDDEDFTVRRNVAVAASELGAAAVEPLTEALGDKNADRRASAAYALGQVGLAAAPAVPELVRRLQDTNAEVRRQASYAIGRILAASRVERPAVAPPLPGAIR